MPSLACPGDTPGPAFKRAALLFPAPPSLPAAGVTAHTLPEVHRLGFKGAALLGSVWQAPDPVAAFEALASACEALGQERIV